MCAGRLDGLRQLIDILEAEALLTGYRVEELEDVNFVFVLSEVLLEGTYERVLFSRFGTVGGLVGETHYRCFAA